ncbi:hypothetical protein TBLA_0B05220 [Henningerozyma blattae CBS 6284]|uniref:Uncharacterized protein n=1 Tax=Henningerozyma blattae (strain ATCC 34711 / CBS 6284 / DSM 70876 / NBRC 10599 / NRRL Y-10934 / UCD 77-7) TaxID=1071380 RepID=I2GZ02_HENB6|nr:hypothetical protein TBLA_0B05220 [Tetrapisispora blattae CBS 6284]CCH59354.1 hypothetical protein TBLA_0B05220 [Tetrapisispora blattae CBS 6284]
MGRYISCLPLNYINNSHSISQSTDQLEIVICNTILTQLPTHATLSKTNIETISLSDGSDVYDCHNINNDDIKMFSSYTEQERLAIWYEYIKLLIGSKISFTEYEGLIQYDSIRCNIGSQEECQLVMERYHDNDIVKKVAVLNLKKSRKELDMFELSQRLFDDYCNGNREIIQLKNELISLKQKLEEEETINRQREKMVEERDEKTRKVFIELLNSKKKKIIELLGDEELRKDELIINRNVTDAVKELNSPGKRKRKTEQPSQKQQTKRRRDDSDEDDFNEFQFFGIHEKNEMADKIKRDLEKEIRLESKDIKQEPKVNATDTPTEKSVSPPDLPPPSQEIKPNPLSLPTSTSSSEIETDTDINVNTPHIDKVTDFAAGQVKLEDKHVRFFHQLSSSSTSTSDSEL